MIREREVIKASRETKVNMVLMALMDVRERRDSLAFRAAKDHRGQMACKENQVLKETPANMDPKEEEEILAKTVNQEDLETMGLQARRETGVLVEPMVIKANEEMTDYQDQMAQEETEAHLVRKVNKVPVVTEGPEVTLVNLGPGVNKDVRGQQGQTEIRVSQEGWGPQVIVAMRVLLGQRELKGPEESKGPQETEA